MKEPVTIDIPFDFEVIGEHRIDPARLLLFGEDGRFYAFNLHDGESSPTQLSDEWIVDACHLRDKLHPLSLN